MTETTAFSANYDALSLSARPQFTGDSRTTLHNGFSATRTFQGYGFNAVHSVMLSATGNVNPFTQSYTLSSYDHYTTLSSLSTNMSPNTSLSASYPEVSGFPISDYVINNDNTITVTFPVASAASTIDVIAINLAGVGLFTQDVTATGISII